MKFSLRGFTLVEILTVVALIVILAFFVLLNVPAQIAKARDAERKGSIDEIGKFIEEYYADTNCYPISIPTCTNPLVLGDKSYISYLPCDPTTRNSYVYVSEISSCPSWFQLYGNLEYTQDKIIDTLGCRNGCGPMCQFNYGIASSNVRLNFLCQNSSATPNPSIPPTSDPGLEIPLLQYVCAPGGACEAFLFPELSGCPDIYLDDPSCQGQCSDPKNRCHDSRGKTN